MDKDFLALLQSKVTGEVLSSEEVPKEFSHDASLFEIKPELE